MLKACDTSQNNHVPSKDYPGCSIYMTTKKSVKNLIVCALLLGFTSSLFAANPTGLNETEENSPPTEVIDKKIKINVGAGVLYGPKYEGHKEEDARFFPLVGIEYGDWSLGIKGLQYQVIKSNKGSLQAGISYDDGRDASDDLPKSPRGLGDIDGGVNFNLKVGTKLFDQLSLSMNTSKSLDHHSRYKITLGAASMFPIYKKRLIGRLDIKSTWHDADYNQLFYGVSPEQSANTSLTIFKAHSGFHDISSSITSILSLTKNLNASLSVVFQTLQSDAARSPVIDRKESVSILQTLSYKF